MKKWYQFLTRLVKFRLRTDPVFGCNKLRLEVLRSTLPEWQACLSKCTFRESKIEKQERDIRLFLFFLNHLLIWSKSIILNCLQIYILTYQVLSSRVEIVENVLLVEQSSRVVPGLAVFAASSQVGQNVVAEMLSKEQAGDAETENIQLIWQLSLSC